jgi:2-hydroxy-palmitic acid dioxygenase Mpo1-like
MSEPAPPPCCENRPVLRFLWQRLEGWRMRHRLPFNFWIHMVGIPLALLVAPALLVFAEWYWALAAFVLGYLLQWVGHLAEGNDLGEWAAIKRLLGLPYVGISPRWGHEGPDRL